MHSLSIFFMVTFSVNNQVLFPLAALTVSIPSEWETVWISICGGSFAQKALCSKQNAESVRLYIMVQIFAGFPLRDQAETVLVFDVPENVTLKTTPLIFRWFNH
jgi:hypothetical protein